MPDNFVQLKAQIHKKIVDYKSWSLLNHHYIYTGQGHPTPEAL